MNKYTLIQGAYNGHFKYYSQVSQDKFVANLLNFKKNGYVVDIGSNGDSSNSYFFDQHLDWKSICIDMIDNNYNRKNATCYKDDATKLDYTKIFQNCGFPNTIDYLSLDVDNSTNDVLVIIPFENYKFSVITIEHDAYAYGEARRAKQREFLSNLGYHIICKDILYQDVYEFEDWWIYPQMFDSDIIKKLESNKEPISNILEKFKL